ncbi:hypothetical protein [Methyloterricola oryzae]|uniref:hypothetical protein n=1 Tax=Methyloterricola oryzae TaxID=1495050 RepID=UPI0011AF9D7E|nr:hypothetical protein [Methyloterricola oryzae]
MNRPKNTLLVFRADAMVGTRPTLADASSGRAGASVPRIDPAIKGRVNNALTQGHMDAPTQAHAQGQEEKMDIEQTELESLMTVALREELTHMRQLVRRARTQGVAEADIFDRVFDSLEGNVGSDELSCIIVALIAREIRRELRGGSC